MLAGAPTNNLTISSLVNILYWNIERARNFWALYFITRKEDALGRTSLSETWTPLSPYTNLKGFFINMHASWRTKRYCIAICNCYSRSRIDRERWAGINMLKVPKRSAGIISLRLGIEPSYCVGEVMLDILSARIVTSCTNKDLLNLEIQLCFYHILEVDKLIEASSIWSVQI